MPAYAGIHLLDTPYCIDNTFDYYIPPNLRRDILCGDFVTVPFGTSNKSRIGVVVTLTDAPADASIDHKAIIGICDKSLSLSDEMLGLCLFLKEQTLCTVSDAVRAVAPTAALTKADEVYVASDSPAPDELPSPTREIYAHIQKCKSVSLTKLKASFGGSVKNELSSLLNLGLIRKELLVKTASEKFEEYCFLSIEASEARQIAEGNSTLKLRSKKHAEILLALANGDGEILLSELTEQCAATRAQINALCDKGLITLRRQTVDRGLGLIKAKKDAREVVLNDEQQAAYDKLCELCDSGAPHGALLHGVTGSGKTSVMMKTIDHVLAKGRSVIVLLPEIALTPQSLEIFCSRYGDRVAVIHSGLSVGERIDTHRRIKNGDADVVIGTRSAVFAPVRSLGLIVIDEEQEHTYKSDMNPKYHTRDVARYRAAYHNAVMLLASATPSFESYKKALDGKYTLIEMKRRYGEAKLPTATVADMRPEVQAGNVSPLGTELCRRLRAVKDAHEQSILFINRRGYNNFISCRDCGDAVKCPQCSVSMTYHTTGASYDGGYLACHWCGKRLPLPDVCPSCGGSHLARIGYGTQRVEQELKTLLPDAAILRMDTDTTTEKNAYENLLGAFRAHEADVLLGTQMVTKGHDFPDVTLVGVLLADSSLYLDDYRAAERTFAMLTQVIGRAGRAAKAGTAVIQTNNPDNECIKLACAQDYPTFYQSEIKLRKLLVFPPFCDIVLMTLTSSDEKELAKASVKLSDTVCECMKGEFSDLPLVVYGPFEAPVYKVEGKYRMRMVIKCKNNKRLRSMLSGILTKFSGAGVGGLSLSIDINPTNL